jgi:hypothetical protein
MADIMSEGADDREVAGWLEEAQGLFAGFAVRSWLEWGGKTLLKDFAARVLREDREEAIAVAKARVEEEFQAEIRAWEESERVRVAKVAEITEAIKARYEDVKRQKAKGELAGEAFKAAVDALKAEQAVETAKWPMTAKPSRPDDTEGEEEVLAVLGATQESTETVEASGMPQGSRLGAVRVPTKRKSSDAMNRREVKGRGDQSKVSRLK